MGGFVASRGQRPRGALGPFPLQRPELCAPGHPVSRPDCAPPCLPAQLCAAPKLPPTLAPTHLLRRSCELFPSPRSFAPSSLLSLSRRLSASAYAGSPAGWCRFPGTSPGERGLPAPAGADAAINSMRRKPPYRAASAATVGRRIRHGKQIVQEFRQGMLAAHHVARTRRSAVSAASSPRRLTSLGEGTHSTSTTSPMRPSAESTIDSPATPHGVD